MPEFSAFAQTFLHPNQNHLPKDNFMALLLALDQGTSSSRSIVFQPDGRVLAQAQQEFRQIYPQPGWVEHDPLEIWNSQLATARQVLQQAGL
jgi:glycerol kinase